MTEAKSESTGLIQERLIVEAGVPPTVAVKEVGAAGGVVSTEAAVVKFHVVDHEIPAKALLAES